MRDRQNSRSLAITCELFAKGAKKLYKQSDGDMWFFELYHHLNDCAKALRSPSILSETVPPTPKSGRSGRI